MLTLPELTVRLRDALKNGPDLTQSLKFDFGEAGFIHLSAAGVTNADDKADCTIRVSPEDFELLRLRRLDPMAAMMAGKVRVVGDMGAAMKLQPILDRIRN